MAHNSPVDKIGNHYKPIAFDTVWFKYEIRNVTRLRDYIGLREEKVKFMVSRNHLKEYQSQHRPGASARLFSESAGEGIVLFGMTVDAVKCLLAILSFAGWCQVDLV